MDRRRRSARARLVAQFGRERSLRRQLFAVAAGNPSQRHAVRLLKSRAPAERQRRLSTTCAATRAFPDFFFFSTRNRLVGVRPELSSPRVEERDTPGLALVGVDSSRKANQGLSSRAGVSVPVTVHKRRFLVEREKFVPGGVPPPPRKFSDASYRDRDERREPSAADDQIPPIGSAHFDPHPQRLNSVSPRSPHNNNLKDGERGSRRDVDKGRANPRRGKLFSTHAFFGKIDATVSNLLAARRARRV